MIPTFCTGFEVMAAEGRLIVCVAPPTRFLMMKVCVSPRAAGKRPALSTFLSPSTSAAVSTMVTSSPRTRPAVVAGVLGSVYATYSLRGGARATSAQVTPYPASTPDCESFSQSVVA